MKITITAPKPRNPLVALARQRRAGSHRPDSASHRQQAKNALMRELNRLKPSP